MIIQGSPEAEEHRVEIQSERAILLECGRCNQVGKLHLSQISSVYEVVLLIFDTHCTLRINGVQYHVEPFTFMLHPFEKGEFLMQMQNAAKISWLHLRFNDDFHHRIQQRGLSLKIQHHVLNPLSVIEVYKILLSNYESQKDIDREITSNSLELLLCLLVQNIHFTERLLHVPHYEKLSQLRREIYLRPEDSWYIQDICDQLCISRPYFHKIYQMAFGISCTQDVIESRITKAKNMLQNSSAPVSEIAQESGFESDVYFMRQFKRHTGMTPTAYRRIFQQSQPSEHLQNY